MVSQEYVFQQIKHHHKNSKPGFFNEWQCRKDINTFFIIRKMINRFITQGQINHKLLLNNFILIINAFGPEVVNDVLDTILSNDQKSVAVSILIYMSCHVEQRLIAEPNTVIQDLLRDFDERVRIIHS